MTSSRLETSERTRLSSCLGRGLADAARARDLAGEGDGTAQQLHIARARDLDVGGVLGRGLDLAAAGDVDLELLHRKIAQPRLARSRDLDRRLIDAALGADRAAATDAKVKIGLADILHHELARS